MKDGNDRVILKCHTGCTYDAIIAAAGIASAELRGASTRPEIVATYDYRSSDGRLVFQVCRLDPKGFRQRKPDGDGWDWSLGNLKRLLYRLPELKASDPEEVVWFAEGEKDVDNLRGLGLIATTSPGGADNWKDYFAEDLVDRDVVILPDNDEPGRKYAHKVACTLFPKAVRVRVVQLPVGQKGGDVTDFLAHHGKDDLLGLVAKAPAWEPSQGQLPAPMAESVTISDVKTRIVEWLWPARIPVGKLTLFDGNPGLGKSLVTLDWVARVTRGEPFYGCDAPNPKGSVLVIGDEDDTADTIRPRLEAAGADLALVDVVPFSPDVDSIGQHIRWRASRGPAMRLVIIDPLQLFLDLIDANDPRGVRKALKLLADLVAIQALGCVAIRHLNKKDGPAIYRGAGSIVIAALARSVMVVGSDPDDKGVRILSMTKCNLSKDPGSLRYRVGEDENGQPTVQWIGTSELDADDITTIHHHNGHSKANGVKVDPNAQLTRAIDWLSKRLERGRDLRSSILLDGNRAGFSRATLDRARAHLPIDSLTPPKTEKGRRMPVWWALTTREETSSDVSVQDDTETQKKGDN